MKEFVLRMQVPEDLAIELRTVSKVEWSLVVNKLLREKLSRFVRLKRIINKSELSESKAFEISDKINESLARRYETLYKQVNG